MSLRIEAAAIDPVKKESLRKNLSLCPPKGQELPPLLCLSYEEEDWLLPLSYGRFLFPKQKRETPDISFSFSGKPLEKQVEKLNRASELLQTEGSVVLNFPTGFGKTFCAVYLAAMTQKLACVVCPRSVLEKQWLKCFNENTNASVWIVGKKPPDIVSVIITSPGKIHHIPTELRKSIGCLIVDEVHMCCTQLIYERLLTISPSYAIALSATTLEMEKHRRDAIALMFGRTIIAHSDKKLNIISYLTGIYIPVNKRYNKSRGRDVEDWPLLCRNMAENQQRNEKIVDLLCQDDGKILVLTYMVCQATTIHSMLLERGENASLFIQKDKNYKDARILVSNYKKAGTGFDDENFCDDYGGVRFSRLYILFSIKGKILRKQALGRLRESNTTVVEFVDDHPLLVSHAEERSKYYKKSKFNVQVLRLY